jgi:hypothetical protein
MVSEEAPIVAEEMFMEAADIAVDRDMPISIDEEDMPISIDEEDMPIDIKSQPKEVVLSEVREQMTRPSPLNKMLLAQRGAIESFVTDNRASIVSLVWWNQSFTISTGALFSASMKA